MSNYELFEIQIDFEFEQIFLPFFRRIQDSNNFNTRGVTQHNTHTRGVTQHNSNTRGVTQHNHVESLPAGIN